MSAEARAAELALEIPDYTATDYQGLKYGSMKSHHQVGYVLYLSGHLPGHPDGSLLHPGPSR